MLRHEYGYLSPAFKNVQFKVDGIKLVRHKGQIIVCLIVGKPAILRIRRALRLENNTDYNPHISILDRPE